MSTRLFRLRLTYVARRDEGQRDELNRPVKAKITRPVRGYYWQGAGIGAQASGAVVVSEDVNICILPPAGVTPEPNDEIRHGPITWQIIGVEAKYSVVRTVSRVHHWKLRVRRAEA